jgi:hypothetical protein
VQLLLIPLRVAEDLVTNRVSEANAFPYPDRAVEVGFRVVQMSYGLGVEDVKI